MVELWSAEAILAVMQSETESSRTQHFNQPHGPEAGSEDNSEQSAPDNSEVNKTLSTMTADHQSAETEPAEGIASGPSASNHTDGAKAGRRKSSTKS